MEPQERLKILLCAYACEPHRGSEEGVGWNWTLQLMREHEVWVLSWSKYRELIERELETSPLPHVHFVYYDMPSWLKPFGRSERLYYTLWQLAVLPFARRLHRQVGFDVIHQLTYTTVEMPGMLWTLDAPFVWGPVGGGQVPPPALKSYFRSIWLVELGRALRKQFLRLNPLVSMAARRAACILVANQDTYRLVESLTSVPLVKASETAVRLPSDVADRAEDEIFTITWWGHFIPRKGPLLALDVAAELRQRGARFQLLMGGVGPWKGLVDRRIVAMGLKDNVKTLGYLTFEEMGPLYDNGDVFLFTSLQDTSGNVVLEAMSHARPVVSLDHQGAAEMLTEECGIKVPILTKQQVVEDMATALQDLSRDPVRRRRMGKAGRRRVAEHYDWDQKREIAAQIYAAAVRGDTPSRARETVGAV